MAGATATSFTSSPSTYGGSVVISWTMPQTTTTLTTSPNPSAVGSAVTLTATVAPVGVTTPTPTGTVTFYVGTTSIGAALLSGGTATFSTPALSVGAHQLRAVYGGNTVYDGSNSAIVTQTVTTVPVTIVAQATGSSAMAPSSTTATAALVGALNPTGNVTFELFGPNDPTCTGQPISNTTSAAGGNLSVSSGSVPLTSPGTYDWLISFAGDVNNSPATTTCGQARVVVGPASPDVVTTAPDPETGPAGSTTLSDSATVWGGNNPTGSVTFQLFGPNNPTCNAALAPPFFTSAAVPLMGTPPTAALGPGFTLPTPTVAGTYDWVASYSGDTSNAPVTTACGAEPVTITKASPTIATTPNPAGPVVVGTALSDSATVSGGSSPTGEVTFELFGPDNTTCSLTPPPLFEETVPLAGGTAHLPAGAFSTVTAGTHNWVAIYNGDESNNVAVTPCHDESVTVEQATPTISTAPSSATAVVGTPIFDTASLTGGFPPFTGTYTFQVFGPGDTSCTTPIQTFANLQPNGDPSVFSGLFTPTTVGAFRWIATYNGDGNNVRVSSPCGEPVNVIQATPSITTRQSPGGPAGTRLSDTATVSGGFGPTGTVTFQLFAPANTTCGGAPVFTSTNPLSGGAAASGTFTSNVGGTFRWVAIYNGDANNLSVRTGCGSEPVNVSGYYLAASDGGIFAFGAPFFGSTGNIHLNKPIVGMAVDPRTGGYWLVASDGGVFAFNAPFFGSTGGIHLNKPIVGIAADPATGGYWLVASDGGIFAFNAPFLGSTGSIRLNKPVVGMAATPNGSGYWLVASDGGVFAFNAPFHGSTGSIQLNKPIVGMAAAPSGNGYWFTASDGGIFAFNAPFHGSTGGIRIAAPVVGMAANNATNGYYQADAVGDVFAFNAPFLGSVDRLHLNKPIVAIATGS
ncbi:MAG: Ig-like domain repeat protein [Acidimicrobiaceae bacterium]|nr:Ig-like domain repeat protein [Acidimicrobiaceae bacterium]